MLAKRPVVIVEHFPKERRRIVEGKAGMADFAALQRLVQKIGQPQGLHVLPGGLHDVVHKIKVHMIRFEPFQLPAQKAVHVLTGRNGPDGQLGRHKQLVPADLLQRLSDERFTGTACALVGAVIGPAGVDIIQAMVHGVPHQAQAGGYIHFPVVAANDRQPHCTEAENGNFLVCLAERPILHRCIPYSY